YPFYHQAEDTADKLDAPSLARMGTLAVAAIDALVKVPRGPVSQPTWFAAFGYVLGAAPLVGLGALSLVPGLAAARNGRAFYPRLAQAGLFGFRPWTAPLALLPLALLLVLGAAAWWRGFVTGLWASPWEVGAAAAGMALLFV